MSNDKPAPQAGGWVRTPPGATIRDLLVERGWTQVMLAEAMGRPIKTINEIIKGKAAITPETALQLEKVFRVDAEFWLTREANYRLAILRRRR